MLRTTAAIAFLCLIALPAQALTCREIREKIAQYGEANVVWWAQWKLGYSDKDILQIRKVCRI